MRPLSASGEEIVEKQTESWSFEIFTKSALYFFLHEKVSRRKQNREPSLCKFDWLIIIPILLNSSINKEIIIFLEDYYNVPDDFKIVAAHFALKRLYLFNLLVMTEESLDDFLVFLKIDEISRKALVKSSFQDRNFDKLTDFLFVFNSSLNQNLILSEVLRNYRYYNKSEVFLKTLEYKDKLLSELFELKLANLEIFDVFDMFDSSENVKSKSSELAFFSFYELLLDNSYTSVNLDFIEIFQLFEKFVYDSKDKSILLAEISFEKSSQFYLFLEKFYYAYQRTLIAILSKQIKLIKKLSKQKIPYDVIVISSILGFLTLLSILGLKPTSLKSERKSLISPQTGCFAMIATPLTQGVKINRAYSDPSLLHSTSFIASATSLENREPFVQARPTPNATVSYNLRKGGGTPVFKQSTLKTAVSGDVKVFIPENSSFFKGMSPTECLDLLVEDISKKFPNCFVNIRQKYGTVDGTYQKLNEITISGSVSQYGQLAKLKTEIIKDTECTEGLIILTEFKKLHRNHVSNTKLREIFNIAEDRGACVFVEAFIHDKMTDERNYNAPSGLGYLPGDGGSIALMDHFSDYDKKIIENFKNDHPMCEGLEEINLSAKDLADSYAQAHSMDRNLVLDNMANMGSSGKAIDENTHLATVQDTYQNRQLAEQLDSVVKRTEHYPKQEVQKLGDTVSLLLQKGQAQREHTHAIKKIVPEGTTAYQNILTNEKKVTNAAEELVSHVEGLGGKVDSDAKKAFFATKSSNLLSPEEAYQQAKTTHGLGDFTNTRSAIPEVGPNRHVPRYPKPK